MRSIGYGEGTLSAREVQEKPVPPHPEFKLRLNSDLSPQAG